MVSNLNMADTPILSIITVVKNDYPGLQRTFESLPETFPDGFEWVVIDGSDLERRTTEVFMKEQIKLGKNVTYKYLEPSGIYPAMNFGAAAARGAWIWFVNAGDAIFQPTTVFEVTKDIRAEGSTLSAIAYAVENIDSFGNTWGLTLPRTGFNPRMKRRTSDINHQGFICKKEIFEIEGGFVTEFVYAADGELLDKVINKYTYKTFDRVVVKFLLGGRSNQNFNQLLKEIEKYRGKEKLVYKLNLMTKNQIRILILKNELLCRLRTSVRINK